MRNEVSDRLGEELTVLWKEYKLSFDEFMKRFEMVEIRKESSEFFCFYDNDIAQCHMVDNKWYAKF